MAAFTITRRLQFRDTDCAGIAHFTSYYGYMEEAEHEMLRSVGLRVFTEDAEGLISWPRVSSHCDFRSPLRFDEEFSIEACVSDITEKSVKYGFRFIKQDTRSGQGDSSINGQLVAEGHTIAACCRVVEGSRPRAIPIPSEMVARLSELKV